MSLKRSGSVPGAFGSAGSISTAFIEQRDSAGHSTGPSTAARLGALEQRVTELAESIERLLED